MSQTLKFGCRAAKGQLEAEGRSFSNSVTVYLDVTSELPHGKRGTVQSETMALFLGGKSALKKASVIFGRDPNAVVPYGEVDELAAIGHLQDQFPVRAV